MSTYDIAEPDKVLDPQDILAEQFDSKVHAAVDSDLTESLHNALNSCLACISDPDRLPENQPSISRGTLYLSVFRPVGSPSSFCFVSLRFSGCGSLLSCRSRHGTAPHYCAVVSGSLLDSLKLFFALSHSPSVGRRSGASSARVLRYRQDNRGHPPQSTPDLEPDRALGTEYRKLCR